MVQSDRSGLIVEAATFGLEIRSPPRAGKSTFRFFANIARQERIAVGGDDDVSTRFEKTVRGDIEVIKNGTPVDLDDDLNKEGQVLLGFNITRLWNW